MKTHDHNGSSQDPNAIPPWGKGNGDAGQNPVHRHVPVPASGGYGHPNRQPSWPTGGNPFAHDPKNQEHGVF